MLTSSLFSSCQSNNNLEWEALEENHILSPEFDLLERDINDIYSEQLPSYRDKYIIYTVVEGAIVITTTPAIPDITVVIPDIYSATVSGSFTRNDCLSGTVATAVTHTVTEYSLISQGDATTKANAKLAQQGPNQAKLVPCLCEFAFQSTQYTLEYVDNKGKVTINTNISSGVQYSIDRQNWQTSKIFNLNSGVYRFYARLNGCLINTGLVEINVPISSMRLVSATLGSPNCYKDFPADVGLVVVRNKQPTCN